MPNLYPYQQALSTGAAELLTKHRKIIVQLATGGGKTRIFSHITFKFNEKSSKKVLILVHRTELLQQTRRTLYDQYNIISQPITAETRHLPDAPVYVGMVETVYKRVLKNSNYLPKNIGLVIIDECHLGNFFKIIPMIEEPIVLGFSATPISARKTTPLKSFYDDIITGPQINELLQLPSGQCTIVPNTTYRPKFSVDPNKFHVKGGDFDEKEMSTEFSKGKHVQNVVEQYEKYMRGTKAIVFNCNIQHSKLVANAFIDHGYQVRHLDGNSSDRAEILKWFKVTPGAILCNVDIATTGFDEPSVETVIVNRSTLSVPLWLQMTGRGSRAFPGKDRFFILDMGANTLIHGDWCDDHDWNDIFHNPPVPSKRKGTAPVKDCPACEAIIPAQATICKFCAYEFPVKEEVYDKPVEMVLHITPVADLVERNADKKEFYTFFQIGNSIATQAKYKLRVMNDSTALRLLESYHKEVEEWCRIKDRKFNRWIKDFAKKHLYSELQKTFTEWHPQA